MFVKDIRVRVRVRDRVRFRLRVRLRLGLGHLWCNWTCSGTRHSR